MKNKWGIIGVLVILVGIVLAIIIFNINGKQPNKIVINGGIKPPLEVDILKDNIKVGKTVGAIASWQFSNSLVTSSLIPANMILEKSKSLENIKAGDIVKISTEKFDITLLDSIYEITYNAMDNESNSILPINEMIDFSNKEINVPILRENNKETLNYYVSIKIKDKGTVNYYFKVNP